MSAPPQLTGSMDGGFDPDQEAIDWLIQVQEAPNDPPLTAAFERWRETPENARAWATLERTTHILRIAGAQRAAGRRKRMTRVVLAGTIAASFALLGTPELVLRWQADALTGSGETRNLKLADGSSILLAPRSAVTIEDRGDLRKIRLLKGMAWFDVVHDAGRPFQVATAGTTTTVLGTAFEVRQPDGPGNGLRNGPENGPGNGAAVAVRRGAVRVSCDGKQVGAVSITAGHALDLACDKPARVSTVSPDQVATWTDGQFIARNVPMRVVIDALRPWYRGVIVARGAGLDRIRVTGVYDLRHPARALAALAEPGDADIRRATSWVMIISAD